MLVYIPDHLKLNVFLIRASGRATGGLYTCNSLIYWNLTEIWDFLGPYRSACTLNWTPEVGTQFLISTSSNWFICLKIGAQCVDFVICRFHDGNANKVLRNIWRSNHHQNSSELVISCRKTTVICLFQWKAFHEHCINDVHRKRGSRGRII